MINFKEKKIQQWGVPLIIALILAIIIKLFFVQTYIKEGNFIFVNKFSKIKANDIVLFYNDKNINIKRCVAIPGDIIFMKNSELFVNNNKEKLTDNILKAYRVTAFDSLANDALFNYYKLVDKETNIRTYDVVINSKMYNQIIEDSIIQDIKPIIKKEYYGNLDVFPHSKIFRWNKDNFGFIVLPKKNTVIKLNKKTYFLYKEIIEKYENNKIEIKDDKFYLNNNEVTTYTFTQNYYFILNDNRSDVNDSRTFGLVPEKNIKGQKI